VVEAAVARHRSLKLGDIDMHTHTLTLAVALAAGFTAPAFAALHTSSAGFGAVMEDFESFDGLVPPTPFPVLIAGGSVIATSDLDMTIGAFAADLNQNGTWGAGNHFAGIGDLVNGGSSYDGSIYLSFAPAYGAGAFFSLYQEEGGTATITLEAYGAGFELLESHSMTLNLGDPTLTNAGIFLGLARAMPEIATLRISGDGFVFDDLRVAASPVPVPAALPLMLGGLGLLGARLRARQA